MTERKFGKNHGEPSRSPAPGDWSGSGRRTESESAALDRILGGFSFPASKEAVAAQLAIEAFSHGGGRAADLHDLIVNLDQQGFRSLEDLHKSIKERHAWEKTHDMLA